MSEWLPLVRVLICDLRRRLLVKNQRVLAKLRGEIEGILGTGKESRIPDRNDLKKMTYLTYVLKEGMYNAISQIQNNFRIPHSKLQNKSTV